MANIADREDFILSLPLDPQGANDPLVIEVFPDHLRLIGLIIAAWSEVEYKLIGLLAIELRASMDTVTAMIYALESSGARLEVIAAAFTTLAEDESARIEAAATITEAQSLLRQRNKFAHALYGESSKGEMAILSLQKGTAVELPLHDLKHQFERMKQLSYRVGRELSIRAGLFQEQLSEQHGSDVLRSIESSLGGVRAHPSPPKPPAPSYQSPESES